MTFNVVLDDNYPPFIFRSSVGQLEGYLVDYWALWEKKTGVRVNLLGTDWVRALEIMRGGQADVIDTAFWTAERDKVFDYGQSYADVEVPVYVRRGSETVVRLEDLLDRKVGVKEGDACIEQLKRAGIHQLVLFRNYEKVIQSAAKGSLDVFCVDAPPADHLLRQAGIPKKFQKAFILYRGQFHYAVKEGDKATLLRLQRGDMSIRPSEKIALRDKWFPGEKGRKVDLAVVGRILAGLLVFLALMGAWVSLLKRQVRQRTRQLEGERRNLRTLIQAIPALVWLKDTNGAYLAANSEFERVFGDSEAKVLGKTDFDLVDKALAQGFREQDLAALGADKPLTTEEWVICAGDGKKILLETTKATVRDGEGKIIGVLGIARDITAQKKAQDERFRLEVKVQQAQKLESLGVLAGGIAHDFNNILTSILGNADLAVEQLSPTAAAGENLRSITVAARRAAELCRQLLAYSGKGRFQVQPLDLRRVVEEMGHLLSVSISKQVTLKYDFVANLPSIEADAAQIRQVVMNLITNASESLGDKNGVIRVSMGVKQCDREYLDRISREHELTPGLYVTLEVSDTGQGMDANTVKKIFDPFFTTKFTGRGLGLAAVLGIVQSHHGAIEVYSEPGKGSVFRLHFPACEAKALNAVSPAPSSRWTGRGKVLLVDDETTVLEVARRMLERAGLTVLTAEDGEEALRIFKREKDILCVVLDLTMPKMDGEECFLAMTRHRPGVKIVLCSGYNEQDVISRFAGKGIAGFVQKPYVSEDLLARVREALEGGDKRS